MNSKKGTAEIQQKIDVVIEGRKMTIPFVTAFQVKFHKMEYVSTHHLGITIYHIAGQYFAYSHPTKTH